MSTSAFTPPALPALERRFATLDGFEIRSGRGGRMEFEGHAAVFEKRSKPLGGDTFTEDIRRGAFRKAIPSSDVRFLLNHDENQPLARSSVRSGPGSLRLSEDTKGLAVDAEWPNTTLARDLAELVDSGVVNEMSFAWPRGAVVDQWAPARDGERHARRSIVEFKALRDVSLVTFPAYPDANDAAMRSLTVAGVEIITEGDEVLEDALRSVAESIHSGERHATPEERFAIDEAYARLNLLSPWIEERARRAFGNAAAGDGHQGAEGDEGDEPGAVGDERKLVSARARQHKYRSLLL
jgi:HK97 family phage prohead protease